jgi:hypothetical protein
MGLEVSPMCDRDAISLCNMQMGFIEFVVAPLIIGKYVWCGRECIAWVCRRPRCHKRTEFLVLTRFVTGPMDS